MEPTRWRSAVPQVGDHVDKKTRRARRTGFRTFGENGEALEDGQQATHDVALHLNIPVLALQAISSDGKGLLELRQKRVEGDRGRVDEALGEEGGEAGEVLKGELKRLGNDLIGREEGDGDGSEGETRR
jgi:hypothetical protein